MVSSLIDYSLSKTLSNILADFILITIPNTDLSSNNMRLNIKD
jgi:hypothetical protein